MSLVLLLAAGLTLWVETRPCQCSGTVECSLGLQPSRSRAQRAALVRIAAEIKRCPSARIVIVHRLACIGGLYDPWYREQTVYHRRDGLLTGELDDFCGDGDGFEQWIGVTDRAVLAVAARHGSISDLGHYGAKPFVL